MESSRRKSKAHAATAPNLACVVAALLAFAGVATAVMLGLTEGIDTGVRDSVHRWASPPLTQLFEGLSFIGSAAFIYTLTVPTIGGLWLLGRSRPALRLAVVMAAAAVLNSAVKFTAMRARPEPFFGAAPDSYSFASGHALFSACFYGVVAGLIAQHLPREWQRAGVLSAALAVIGGIGLSRIYLGVHHLTDVVAGFALAALIVCSVRALIAAQN
jgi:undecaprenyl-diphosphatase